MGKYEEYFGCAYWIGYLMCIYFLIHSSLNGMYGAVRPTNYAGLLSVIFGSLILSLGWPIVLIVFTCRWLSTIPF
jgi:hypothetical protein